MPDSYLTKIRRDQSPLWKGKTPLLQTLDMELTERCNFNCIHCYINRPAGSTAVQKRELATDAVKTVLSEAAALGCLSVRFTGGEPLLREDFNDIYLFTRKLGMKVWLFTNAALITPALVKILGRIPALENIEITLYGVKKKSYEAITRTPGSFEAAFDGIHLLRRSRIPFELKTVILPPNRNELAEFEILAKSFPETQHPPGLTVELNLRARRDSRLKNACIQKLRISPEESIRILARRRDDYLKEMKLFCAGFMAPAGKSLFPCGAGKDSACVDAYGDLQPCMLLRHPQTVYRLNGGSLKDAMTRFFPEMRRLQASHPEYLRRCARCFLKGLCEQCPAKSWMEHGTLDMPVDYLCNLAHTQARYLGLIGPGEKAWEVLNWKERIHNFTGLQPRQKSCQDAAPCHEDI